MAAGLGAMVLMTPLVLRYVGVVGYGLWAVINSLQNYCLLLDFGMNTATAKYTSEYRALRQPDALSQLASTILVLVLGVGIAIVALAWIAGPLVPRLLKIPAALAPSANAAIVVMALNAAVMLSAGVFGNIIYGHQRTDVWKLFGTAQIVVNAAVAIFLLRWGLGIVGLAWAGVISNTLLAVLCLWFINTRLSGVRINLRLASAETLHEILPYSARAFGLSLTSRVLYYSDYIVIGVFLGAAAVTPYEIGYKVCFLATYCFSVLSFASFPRLAELAAEGRQQELGTAYLRLVKLTMLVLVPVDVFLLVWGQALIRFWVGPASTPANSILLVLVIMNVFHAIGTPASTLLQSAGRNRELLWSEMANAVLNVALSIALVGRLGALGVAIGTLVAHLATSFWIVILLPCRTLGFSCRRYLASALLPPLALGCPFLLLLGLPAAPTGLFEFGLAAAALCVLYFGAYATLGSTPEERATLKRYLAVAWRPSVG
jgi:O-antigen/teichoic acid export membrane protein